MKKAKQPESAKAGRASNNISVRLPNDLIAWLDEQAAQERRSRGSFIKIVLEDLREKREKS